LWFLSLTGCRSESPLSIRNFPDIDTGTDLGVTTGPGSHGTRPLRSFTYATGRAAVARHPRTKPYDMNRINPAKAGVSVGLVMGLYHMCWATLVALGLAKPFMDFVLRLHFIEMNYEMAAFSVSTAASLIALTFAIGAAFA
jgi:hypothetical protein